MMPIVAPRATLSQDDILLIVGLIDDINRTILPKVFETLFFGILTLLVGICIYVLMQRVLLATILIMYIVSLIEWAIDVQLLLYDLQLSPEILATGNVDAKLPGNTAAIEGVDAVASGINIILGDMVILWRACVVYGYRKAFLVPSAMLGTMVFVNWLLATVNGVRTLVLGYAPIGNAVAITVLAYSSSLLLNVWVTSTIVIMAWRHRRRIRAYVQAPRKTTVLERIIALLVESSAVYTLLWIIYMGTTLGNLESGGGIGDCMAMLIPMYPVLVIILVALQKSPGDHQLADAAVGSDPTTVEGQRRMLANLGRSGSQGHSGSVFIIGNDFHSADLAAVDVKVEKGIRI
ncbi:hypothetical protein K488DRAFT_83307 [Vararia minispora EC-137]|uniref:Uncharacterized protein n=1 Tax=Vararia minispora EC-137 TaxID=1314806 RepID=A0ACB8QUN8_9AGAM|nr:hypothetical protein K488DRAFT_83307 [Vararia minispora EC-137]